MVVGNGLLARCFESYNNDDRFLIFASGVSNSKTKNQEAYLRETLLLEKSIAEHPGKIIVYFSTCSVYDPDEKNSAYVKHKLNIEAAIQKLASQLYIFRVSNVAGKSSNPNTLLNYFFHHIKNEINFDLWANACRNIIDIDDVFSVADEVLKNNPPSVNPINIASPFNYTVKEIVAAIESFLNVKSNYIEVDKGSCFEIELSVTQTIFQKKQAKTGTEYLASMFAKYF